MTLVIDPHPLLYAVVMAMAAVFFIGMSLFVAAYYGRRWRRATERWKRFEARYRTITMALCSLFFIAFTVMGWLNAHPHTVVLGDDAMELRYVWSSREIPYGEIRRIEFGVRRNRGVERHYVVLRRPTHRSASRRRFIHPARWPCARCSTS